MTPQEALKLIDHVLQNVSGTRADHQKIAEAISVLERAVERKKDK